jgi:hypothetical protein
MITLLWGCRLHRVVRVVEEESGPENDAWGVGAN